MPGTMAPGTCKVVRFSFAGWPIDFLPEPDAGTARGSTGPAYRAGHALSATDNVIPSGTSLIRSGCGCAPLARDGGLVHPGRRPCAGSRCPQVVPVRNGGLRRAGLDVVDDGGGGAAGREVRDIGEGGDSLVGSERLLQMIEAGEAQGRHPVEDGATRPSMWLIALQLSRPWSIGMPSASGTWVFC